MKASLGRLALSIAALPVFACGGVGEDDIPLPDLTGVESAIVEAVRDARGAVRRDRDSAAAWGALADRYLEHKWHAEAAEAYRRAAEIDAADSRWIYRRGHCLVWLDRREEALEVFNRFLAVRADYAPAHLAVGNVLRSLGRNDEAIERLRVAERLDPGGSGAKVGLGRIALEAGRFDDALRQLAGALQRQPDDGEAHQALAQTYMALGDAEQAEYHARRTRELPKTTPRPDPLARPEVTPVGSQAHNTRGSALAAAGALDEAEKAFRAALRDRPDYAEAHFNLGTVLARRGALEEAIEHLTTAATARPGRVESHVNLGLALAGAGRVEEAERSVLRALELDPQHRSARLTLGKLMAATGRHKDATREFRRVLETEPRHAEAASRLAWLLATSGDAGLRDGVEAVRLAREACEWTGRNNAATFDILAAAYAELGRFDEAQTSARRAIDLAMSAGQAELAESVRERLAGYAERKPHRE